MLNRIVLTKTLPKTESSEKDKEKRFEQFRKHCDRIFIKYLVEYIQKIEEKNLFELEQKIIHNNILKIVGRISYEKNKNIKQTKERNVQNKYLNSKKEQIEQALQIAQNFFSK